MTVRFIRGRQNDNVFGRIEGINRLTRRGIRQAMFRTGRTLIDAASNEILHGQKTGRVYIRRDRIGRRRRHRSSAPGETHANMTGALRRSLSFQLRGTSEIEFGYGVSSGRNAPIYARAIEFGYEPRNLIPRPSLRNALDREQGNITQHFQREIIRAQT
jgi:hypothetical protein